MATGAEELLKVLPRFVDRTRRQAAFTRSLVSLLACPPLPTAGPGAGVSPLTAAGGDPAAEPLDVLDLLGDPEPVEPSSAVAGGTTPLDEVPEESELGIQDYDSLAASQVVPRLATLAPDALQAIQRYERANRHRQTILNRVAQLLADG